MYFVNEQHKINFKTLLQRFKNNKSEYICASYIAAVPEIFQLIDFSEELSGPFHWYFDNSLKTKLILGNLSKELLQLVELGLHFWTAQKFSLQNALFTWRNNKYLRDVLYQVCELKCYCKNDIFTIT
ncbi:DUF2538 family protein [Gottfriedia acidiceleris]|uniref:DUF2538 family protein n=1 Tax=Gottfriedia acidiceleris TaxID=371036 RepID=A0ABY4JI51_9BACI|nr:DUF2538 family protein [Gottfriedia acidiceleris]UPM52442.1 DUF2538 family protein [Gottfriedia acidiceleris]